MQQRTLAPLRATTIGDVLLLVELLRSGVGGSVANVLQAVDWQKLIFVQDHISLSLSTIMVMTFKSIPLCYACYVRGGYECGWGRQQTHLMLYTGNSCACIGRMPECLFQCHKLINYTGSL